MNGKIDKNKNNKYPIYINREQKGVRADKIKNFGEKVEKSE